MAKNRGGCLLCALATTSVIAGCGGADQLTVADYNPSKLGDNWSYAVTTPSGAAFAQTVSVTQSSAAGFTLKTVIGDSSSYFLDTLSNDDASGIVLSTSSVFDASGPVSVETLSPPGLVLATDLTPHHAASSTSRASTVGAANVTFTDTRQLTVDGTESVTVPAGTFSALKVTTLLTSIGSSISTPPSTIVRWWARDVGFVKEVVFPNETPANATTWELTSYRVQ